MVGTRNELTMPSAPIHAIEKRSAVGVSDFVILFLSWRRGYRKLDSVVFLWKSVHRVKDGTIKKEKSTSILFAVNGPSLRDGATCWNVNAQNNINDLDY